MRKISNIVIISKRKVCLKVNLAFDLYDTHLKARNTMLKYICKKK